MGRPKKVNIEAQTEIPESRVWDVLQFAASLYNGTYGLPGIYTPQLVNSRAKDINLNPLVATADKIDTALSKPKDSERELIGYTQWLELNNMLFKRILHYYSGLLSFDLTYVCKNIKDEKEYSSSAYLKDLQLVNDFFDRFNPKQEFKTIMRQLMRQEAYFSVFRDEGEKYTFQELSEEYCLITGRWDNGNLLFDFNMYYMLLPGININMFPDVFKKMYNEVFDGKNVKSYDPSLPIDSRNSSYVYYHQTSPKDNFFCFKFSPELITRLPWISPLMGDAVLQPIIRNLQKNSYIQQASKIIYTEVPLLSKDLKGATTKDAVAISPDLLGKFLSLVAQALPDAVKIAASPTQETQAISFDGNNEIYQSYLQNTAASSGVNSRLIFSIDRQNVQETTLSMDIDQNVLTPLYYPFANFLEFYINNKVTKKYKFKFMLEGFETTPNRKERFDTQMTLCDRGIVLPGKIAASLGMLPNDFYRMLAEGRAMGFVDKLTPIINAAQMSNKSSDGGRPQKDQKDLTDSGSQTRADGENLARGGEV